MGSCVPRGGPAGAGVDVDGQRGTILLRISFRFAIQRKPGVPTTNLQLPILFQLLLLPAHLSLAYSGVSITLNQALAWDIRIFNRYSNCELGGVAGLVKEVDELRVSTAYRFGATILIGLYLPDIFQTLFHMDSIWINPGK
ncbi:uncharacterized protein LACBIDRAFT_328496 [Laccaria bicolor S238N-H82]|uniref:Predicted protein n=1 Tax=Laccaria bicolor (strain S238N-H82 / ATCC MYA-4686) TaxID=486041 RepID=B0DF09_LACBS|nr:uncharacterized protein LACBIDRAFT_328496 [Laccaria bicolor S238N-H82]EDR06638.1 predicted protein [Laccaria bicolor S238N-H82]|eukprot:XP_001882485.1 predicted protein [Laccaria bicolor S238N-H82]